MKRNMLGLALGAVLLVSGSAFAAGDGDLIVEMLPEGSVDREAGLKAWDRIHQVLSHPRCSNCHVDERNIPLWSTLDGEGTRPHGMNVVAGDSRIGAELILCSTCHVVSTRPNDVPHAAPHIGVDWQLAPVEFVWAGKTSQEICEQVRDPERNGGRDLEGLVEHITHDAELQAFITWGFDPGGGREAAPFGMQAHLDDFIEWGAAGMPCEG